MATPDPLRRSAVRVEQTATHSLYLFTLKASEILQIADISRVNRDDAGKLIGYQRPAVRNHVKEITNYLNGTDVLFPNPIILALSSRAKFTSGRGPTPGESFARNGKIEIPVPAEGHPRPAWIVDGQQRAIALSKCDKKDLPVPVTAFITDSVDVQRDQFLRVNNTKSLPRGLVTELLPEVSTLLSPRLSIKKMASELCNLLNQNEKSPFCGLIRRASSDSETARTAIVTDTAVVKMLEERLSSSGFLFIYRNMTSGETDFESLWASLIAYWTGVKETFPDAWGKPPNKSRLMHSVGIVAMGRLMDRVLSMVDPSSPAMAEAIRGELALLAPHCRWTSGTWDEIGAKWNAVEYTHRHIQELSNFLIRTYMKSRVGRP